MITVVFFDGRKANFQSFSSLESIPQDEYDNIRELYCVGCGLTKLSWKFPKDLRVLNCSENQIEIICGLPRSLEILDCNSNKITFIFLSIQRNLSHLYCYDNQLRQILFSFESQESGKLKVLHCQNNQIETIDSKLPEGMMEFLCDNNRLTEKPYVPSTVQKYSDSGNIFTHNSIITHTVSQKLPEVPYRTESMIIKAKRTQECLRSWNRLPELPSSLEILSYQENQSRELPEPLEPYVRLRYGLRLRYECDLKETKFDFMAIFKGHINFDFRKDDDEKPKNRKKFWNQRKQKSKIPKNQKMPRNQKYRNKTR